MITVYNKILANQNQTKNNDDEESEEHQERGGDVPQRHFET